MNILDILWRYMYDENHYFLYTCTDRTSKTFGIDNIDCFQFNLRALYQKLLLHVHAPATFVIKSANL